MTAPAVAPKAGRREWVGLAVLALPCLLYSMDLTVLNLAVPHLVADLQPSSTQLLWIVDIYGFLVAGSLITMGTLGDRIGRRKLLLIGAVAFGLASIFAAFSTSAEMLIAARALLGIAAATLAPSTLSLLRNMFHDDKERTFAIGIWIASFSAGGAIGPLIGGALLEYFWWGSVFLIALPVMVLLLAVGPFLLPEYRDADAGKIDIQSVVLSIGSVLAVIYGIKNFAEHGAGWLPAAAILAGLAVGYVFVRRQQKLAAPLIDLSIFRSLPFTTSLSINILSFFIAFSAFLLIAQYLQLVLGMGALEAGLWSAPSGIGFIVGSTLSPAIAQHFRPSYVIAGGLLIAAIGFVLLTQIGGPNELAVVVAGYVVFSIGLAPVFTMTTDLIVGTVAPEKAGAAAGIAETSSEFGGALGIALLGSIVTALYRADMSAVIGAGLPPEALDAARDTLGGAVAVAVQVSGEPGMQLLAAARLAFTQALQLTMAISAAIALAAAIVTLVLLRQSAESGKSPLAETST
ncbi:MFS transporter, DHA2 family, multidrug resistance protein [Mesorhizobium albiziae]|uniref:MFS transporter, DHA2 family, multidrug resistance protein n=1 Tax=Neomesorhizobium albiziae TaxID=335020 RepID=A0A1I4AXI4_9HYPH|nr:MFS transporter [Mesorhizobium albiziae]GLS34170.1 MFS transporter [Mesorhizobium albiziae]SFK61205.1 MFS transporter, DHA2 family, multidrug resistance protein [Mesorhizobium albiziae]